VPIDIKNRTQSPALLRGLIFGADGRAMSPTHTRRRGRLYRYYVSQQVLKGTADPNVVRRVPAAEIEAAVVERSNRSGRCCGSPKSSSAPGWQLAMSCPD